ncbi:hypothetical protein [Leucobacter luti]|nr:hypothetical protein [Leucobacter luti]
MMRDNPRSPIASISRVTDTTGAERYLVYTWALRPHERHMAVTYESLVEAATSVP